MIKKLIVPILLFCLLTFVHFAHNGGLTYDPALFSVRLSVYLAEILIAAILAVSGMILQTLLANPLAEPYVLGVSGGASFGAVTAVFLGLTPLLFYRSAFALAGAAGVSFAVYLLSRKRSGFSIGTAVLAGVGFNALFTSLILLLQSLLTPNDFQSSVVWLSGRIDLSGPAELLLLAAGLAAVFAVVLRFGKELDIYRSGEEMALAVGVDTARLKAWAFAAASFACGIAVSVSGMIGFVGLVVPHVARMIAPSTHRKSLPMVALIASDLMLLAGILSRVLKPGTLFPIGVLTSLIGAPFFIWLLVRKQRT